MKRDVDVERVVRVGEAGMLSREEEARLIAAAQQGDGEAFGLLVRAYEKKTYYIALSIMCNHDDAVDACQDTFLRAYKAIRKFNVGQSFFPWLSTIAFNQCVQNKRGRQRRAAFSLSFDGDGDTEQPQVDVEDTNLPSPHEVALASQSKENLWRAIEKLSCDLRETVVMYYYHNLTYKEIADTMGIPIGTIMSRLSRAKFEMKRTLERRSAVS